ELADVSSATLVLTIVLYGLAMLAYAGDLAFGKRQSPAVAPARQPERAEAVALVGAAGSAEFAGHAFPADPGDPSELADLSPTDASRTSRNGYGGAGAVSGLLAGGVAAPGADGGQAADHGR